MVDDQTLIFLDRRHSVELLIRGFEQRDGERGLRDRIYYPNVNAGRAQCSCLLMDERAQYRIFGIGIKSRENEDFQFLTRLDGKKLRFDMAADRSSPSLVQMGD